MRALGSDARAGSWARGRARVAQRKFVRRSWRIYLVFLVALLVTTVMVAASMPTQFLRGLVVGGFLAAGVAALWSFTVQATGTASTMMGDLAEQWTASELRRMRDQGWHVVNHFVLATDDIDHVLVGPGGAYALETKWSATPWESDFGRARLRYAVGQASANARRLRLWHPLKSRRVQVEPVVVLWGGGVPDYEENERITSVDGVTVLTGHALLSWAVGRDLEVLSDDQIIDVWAALDEQVARRDPHDAVAHPVPASIGEMLLRAGGLVMIAVLGLIALGQLVRYVQPAWLALSLGAGAVVPSLLCIRRSIARAAALAWLIGLGFPLVALAIAEAVYQATH
jgi:hypothetical protein